MDYSDFLYDCETNPFKVGDRVLYCDTGDEVHVIVGMSYEFRSHRLTGWDIWLVPETGLKAGDDGGFDGVVPENIRKVV